MSDHRDSYCCLTTVTSVVHIHQTVVFADFVDLLWRVFFFFFFFFKSSVFRCERWWHGVNRDGKQRGQDLKFKWLLSPQHLLPWHPFENIANQSCGSAPNMKRTHTYTRTMHNSANTQTLEPLVSHLLCVCVNVSSSFLINAMRTSAHTHTHTHTHINVLPATERFR